MSVPYWRLSGFYFCYFATLGAFLPFWSLYLKQVGFAATEIGELTAFLVATKIIAPNYWGWLADKTGRNLRLIRITSLLSVLCFAGFLYRSDYLWFAAVTVIFSFFWNATLPQFEAATLFHLQAEPQRYSQIRLWGSIGFIAAVLGIGRFLDQFSIAYLPWIIGSLMLLNWLMALITPEAKPRLTHTETGGIRQILMKPELLAFLLVYMLLQVAHGPYYVFYSVYLKQHGYSATETGLLWASGVAAEVLLFMAMRQLLKWLSPRTLLLASVLLSVLRWLLIAEGVDSLALTICAQILHAATFGVAHVVAMQLLYHYFGERHQSKGQALYSSISFGLGGMIGSLYSGYFWDMLGGRLVYIIAALVCCVALLITYIGVARQSRPGLG
ncbi:MFS transporter [Methylomonas sp. MO1]|uniref:MFS transporter n=1 Tax=Methylomonas sp. MO1 TaxID=3073619 RepID=UPI0028A4A3AA|nr:MFS transporter [Methylomonas sp. MO1]MDT4291926.1 MFS transporter [Methylomonas sp. MO1]